MNRSKYSKFTYLLQTTVVYYETTLLKLSINYGWNERCDIVAALYFT